MPAIASLEDLKATQKDLHVFTLCPMLLCSHGHATRITDTVLMRSGGASVGRMSVSCGYRSVPRNN